MRDGSRVLQLRDELPRLLRRRKARALQQQLALRIHELEMKLAVGLAVLLEAGQGALALVLLCCSVHAREVAQAHGLAQFGHQRRRALARLRRAGLQDLLELLRMADEVLVARAHGRDLAIDAIEQQLLGVAPRDALGIGLAQLLRLLRRSKGLVD